MITRHLDIHSGATTPGLGCYSHLLAEETNPMPHTTMEVKYKEKDDKKRPGHYISRIISENYSELIKPEGKVKIRKKSPDHLLKETTKGKVPGMIQPRFRADLCRRKILQEGRKTFKYQGTIVMISLYCK